jgi:16S rRNA U1498 N3-methylase RsmE
MNDFFDILSDSFYEVSASKWASIHSRLILANINKKPTSTSLRRRMELGILIQLPCRSQLCVSECLTQWSLLHARMVGIIPDACGQCHRRPDVLRIFLK